MRNQFTKKYKYDRPSGNEVTSIEGVLKGFLREKFIGLGQSCIVAVSQDRRI